MAYHNTMQNILEFPQHVSPGILYFKFAIALIVFMMKIMKNSRTYVIKYVYYNKNTNIYDIRTKIAQSHCTYLHTVQRFPYSIL